MPKLPKTLVWLALLLPVYPVCEQGIPAPGELPSQLIREVVYNELNDHQQHGFWRYWVARRTPSGITAEMQVETSGGPVTVPVFANGSPLNPAARQQEQARLDRLLDSPQEQARHLRQYEQDEQRIGRIVAMLPDAFLFSFDGQENGCYRLHFQPNPSYAPRTMESRIIHAMTGTVWVDARFKRLAGLEGRVEENVDFGFGLVGRLCKGGWFRLQRVQVSPTDWKTERLEMHMNIRALLVTSFARETSEVRGCFTRVPAGMSVGQGIALLEQSESLKAAPESIPAGLETAENALACNP
jgi:hypothetical protein